MRLTLKSDEKGIYRCRGRIQGSYPIYLPATSLLSMKIVEYFHLKTYHGFVTLTMGAVREDYWIPRLRKLVKKVLHRCNWCKRFRAKAYPTPSVGLLPRDRTEGDRTFQRLGLDFAGPISYKLSNKRVGKCYILLYSCSLIRAAHLDLLENQTNEEVMKSIKRLVA